MIVRMIRINSWYTTQDCLLNTSYISKHILIRVYAGDMLHHPLSIKDFFHNFLRNFLFDITTLYALLSLFLFTYVSGIALYGNGERGAHIALIHCGMFGLEAEAKRRMMSGL